MREHFPSTGRGARLADAFASWRAAVITFQLLARRRQKKRFNYFGGAPNIDESRKARENAAERKRSRSEADTGQRIGQCFGLNLLAVL